MLLSRSLTLITLCCVMMACSYLPVKRSSVVPVTPSPFVPSSIAWQDCNDSAKDFQELFPTYIPEGLLCGRLVVPLDPAQPQGKTISLALTRMPAQKAESKGTLVVISGGPGEHSLDFVNTSLTLTEENEKILQQFDVIGYAPRGVSPSVPFVDCGKSDIEKDHASYFVKQCVEHTGLDVLKNISSTEAVQDLEWIRQALGQTQLSFLAYSYGTRILNDYVQRYPQAVRAGVFDGVVDTTEDYFTAIAGQERGFQQTFERFAAFCLKYHHCAWKKGEDPNLAFQRFITKTDTKKLKDKQGKIITAEDVLYLVQSNLYWQDDWERIIDLMTDFSKNRSHAYNEQVYALSLPEEVEKKQALADFSLIAINCADAAVKNLTAEQYIKQAKMVDDLSPFDNYPQRKKTDDDYLDACFYWPFAGKDQFQPPKPNVNLPPLLFVAQRYDPTTPLHNAQKMAKIYQAPLIIREGDGHTLALNAESECVDRLVRDYLFEPDQKIESQSCD